MDGKSKETCEDEDELTEWLQLPQWGSSLPMPSASSAVSSITVPSVGASPNVGSFHLLTSASMESCSPPPRGVCDRGPRFSRFSPASKEVGSSPPLAGYLGSSASVDGYLATIDAASVAELGLVVSLQASTASGFSCSSSSKAANASEGGSSDPRSPISRGLLVSVSGEDKEHVGTSGSHSRCMISADGAMALAARRAAGLVSQTGVEAFDRVRTSKQPPQSNLKHCPRLIQAQSSSTQPLHLCPKEPRQSIPARSSMPSATKHGETFGTPSPRGPFHDSPCVDLGAAFSSFDIIGLEKASTAPVRQFCNTQIESVCSHPMDDTTVRTVSQPQPANSEGNLVQICSDGLIVDTIGRFSSPSEQCLTPSDIKASASDFTHLVSHLARSQTDFQAIAREDICSRKRNLQDSDYQSDDFDVDCTEMKQPRKSLSKRNRAPEVHNLSEKRRRSRINEKMKALQGLIPNSCKTDKASILEEAIEYMKTLQLQLQMVSTRSSMSLGAMTDGVPSMSMVPMGSTITPMTVPGGLAPMQMGEMTPLHLLCWAFQLGKQECWICHKE